MLRKITALIPTRTSRGDHQCRNGDAWPPTRPSLIACHLIVRPPAPTDSVLKAYLSIRVRRHDTADQLFYSALGPQFGKPPKRDLAASIPELREMAVDRDDILAEAAGITAQAWYADPAAHVADELVAPEC